MTKGFTLVEMVVVLVVMAVLAHVGVAELGRVRERRLREAADLQLEEVRRAVWECGADASPCGFLADMGRLPRLADGTLAELWKRPVPARSFAVLPATAENICIADEAERDRLSDAGVFVPTGWRGPYLRLPIAGDSLLDPWGNSIAARDEANLQRVWTDANGFATNIAHYGASAQSRDRRDCPLVPDGGASASLTLSAEIVSDAAFTGTIEYRWYGPADGMITGAVASVAYPGSVRFDGLTPGVRIVKDSVSGLARRVVVKPGDNLFQFRIVK